MEQGKTKGISISKVSNLMFIITIFFGVFVLLLSYELISSTREISQAVEDYSVCTDDLTDILEASNFLTNQARYYVNTGNSEYIRAYYIENYVDERRDNAEDSLAEHNISVESEDYYIQALADTDRLEKIEYHAIKLVMVATKLDKKQMAAKLFSEYSLSDEELHMTPEEMMQRAQELVYSEEYAQIQTRISGNLQIFRENIDETLKNKVEALTEWHSFMVRLLFLIVAIFFALLVLNILLLNESLFKPLKINKACIEDNIRMSLQGASEIQALAIKYNDMYERHSLYENDKKYEGKRDHVTGAVNHAGFNETMYEISLEKRRTTLIAIEIDDMENLVKYNSVNHMNAIMLEVYNALCTMVNFKDLVYRVDNSLFVVTVYDLGLVEQEEIVKLAEKAFEHLKKSSLTRNITLSMGAAFTDASGYENALYNNAEVALYKAKDDGGNRIVFYSSDLF